MKLVIDSNVLVSFFRENPVNEIICRSKFLGLKLFAPGYVIGELKKNEKDILKYSGLSRKGFNDRLSDLKDIVELVQANNYKRFKLMAKKLSPHDKDIPIFALALRVNCGIWSNEFAFRDQDEIEIFSTREMIELVFG